MSSKDENESHYNRTQLAETFGVSLPTIDAWIRKGCPYVEKGGNGKAWQFRLQDVARWREKMARESEQDWKGGHVKAPHGATNPALAALMAQRPDLENPLRFFIEDAMSSFVRYWLAAYPWIIIEQLHKETGDKVKAVRLLQAAVGRVLELAGMWTTEDHYSKSLGRDNLDAIWRDVTGLAIGDTAAPSSPELLLFADAVPRFLTMEPGAFVAAHWQGEMPDAEGMQIAGAEEEAEA